MAVVEQETVVEAPSVTPADVFRRAADLLEEFGWCQREYARDRNGNPVTVSFSGAASFCLIGSIMRAANDLATIWDWPMPESIEWNDEPGRTREEVIAVLRAAADAA